MCFFPTSNLVHHNTQHKQSARSRENLLYYWKKSRLPIRMCAIVVFWRSLFWFRYFCFDFMTLAHQNGRKMELKTWKEAIKISASIKCLFCIQTNFAIHIHKRHIDAIDRFDGVWCSYILCLAAVWFYDIILV